MIGRIIWELPEESVQLCCGHFILAPLLVSSQKASSMSGPIETSGGQSTVVDSMWLSFSSLLSNSLGAASFPIKAVEVIGFFT